MAKEFYSNGKLLLTGEYAVLDGAEALALPTKFGQSLSVTPSNEPKLSWQSFNVDGSCWFTAELAIPELKIITTNDFKVAETLTLILQQVREQNPTFLMDATGYCIKTVLTFERNWGLGTSSTLITNIALWGQVDPYQLLQHTFGGSGYDLACATAKTPLIFELKKKSVRIVPTVFKPVFADKLFFVYLNQKQDSRKAIKNYRAQPIAKTELVRRISSLTHTILHAKTLDEFERLLVEHEQLLSEVLQIPRVQTRLFPDFEGTIKSLGAWGGDFVLATGNEKTPGYFLAKGFHTVIPFEHMVL
ncbi:Hypothetical protein I595_1086 [Croceitalea dokdonensis DOKDO 023]|uniref:GHMP kinase n=1 Tax=Croceitalea dokdonensis DOKDO 023 TaxID=1300341 RepID=A0A0N8H484_9FLAO|nr:GYDIA family GHMP kinase [Croceitalea dokdonensis]KPM32660.1 Hypothetical protein I595_1086 [Croceitalea dokdonensis DOKDO 023]